MLHLNSDRPPQIGPIAMSVYCRCIGQSGRSAERGGAGRPDSWDDRFRGRWSVARAAMEPDCIVVTSPSFDKDLGLAQRGEDLPIEDLAATLRTRWN